MNYRYYNGLLLLDSYYTSVIFQHSPELEITKHPNEREIRIKFPKGTTSSEITEFEMIEDVELQESVVLLNNTYITINNLIYYPKSDYIYLTQYMTDFYPNKVLLKESIYICILNTISFDEYKELLNEYFIIRGTTSDQHLFNVTLLELDNSICKIEDRTVYKQLKNTYIDAKHVIYSFKQKLEEVTGLRVFTSLDQLVKAHALEKSKQDKINLDEYIFIKADFSASRGDFNRIFHHFEYGRMVLSTVNILVRYSTKYIELFDKRINQMLLINDMNSIVTLDIKDGWTASVIWDYGSNPDSIEYSPDEFESTNLLSLGYLVKMLYFTVEKTTEYPKILSYIIKYNQGNTNEAIT